MYRNTIVFLSLVAASATLYVGARALLRVCESDRHIGQWPSPEQVKSIDVELQRSRSVATLPPEDGYLSFDQSSNPFAVPLEYQAFLLQCLSPGKQVQGELRPLRPWLEPYAKVTMYLNCGRTMELYLFDLGNNPVCVEWDGIPYWRHGEYVNSAPGDKAGRYIHESIHLNILLRALHEKEKGRSPQLADKHIQIAIQELQRSGVDSADRQQDRGEK